MKKPNNPKPKQMDIEKTLVKIFGNGQTKATKKDPVKGTLKVSIEKAPFNRYTDLKLSAAQTKFVIKSYATHRYIDPKTGCWFWRKKASDPKSPNGVNPQLWLDGFSYPMNRLAWAVENKKVPANNSVLSMCGKSNCFAPKHHDLSSNKKVSRSTKVKAFVVKKESQTDTVIKTLGLLAYIERDLKSIRNVIDPNKKYTNNLGSI